VWITSKSFNNHLLGTLRDWKLKKTGKMTIIFQQDNDPKHTSHVASDWFAQKKVKKLAWPPSSPDMNIIKHVWCQTTEIWHDRESNVIFRSCGNT
jgi:hypothetical protein